MTGFYRTTLVVGLIAAPSLAQPRWVAWFDGGAQKSDGFRDALIDRDGNVYVTGGTWIGPEVSAVVTAKYSPTGEPLWFRAAENEVSCAIGIDADRNLTVTTGDGYYKTGITRYDADGNRLWRTIERRAAPTAAVTLADGTTFVCGIAHQVGGGMMTLKLGSDGTLLWRQDFAGGGRGRHAAYDLAVDDGGNAYVVGRSVNPGTGQDAFLLKYGPDGTLEWAQSIDGIGSNLDEAQTVVLSADGSPVTFGTLSTLTGDDLFGARFDTAGNQVWLRTYDDATGLDAWPLSAVIDDDDRIVVCASAPMGEYPKNDFLTLGVDGGGDLRWFDTYGAAEGLNAFARGIQLDREGHAYVTGYSHSLNDIGNDITTIKYSQEGARLWVTRFNGREDVGDTPSGIAIAPDGRTLAVVGKGDYVHNSDLLTGDALVIAYPTTGNGCTERETLTTKCIPRGQRHKIQAKTKKGTPGQEVEFCLNGGDCVFDVANDRGKAKAKWTRIPHGSHDVRIDWECGARRTGSVECG